MSMPAQKLLKALENGLLFFLAVRSFTEALSGWTLPLGLVTLNLSIVSVLLADALALGYLGWLWGRGRWSLDRIGFFFLLWVLSLGPWVYLGSWEWGSAGLTGLREWARLLSLGLLYLSLYAIAKRRGSKLVLNVCLVALPLPLAFTYYQTFFDTTHRTLGAMVHPNNFAAFMVVMLGLTIWKWAHPGARWPWRVGWGLLLIVELFALLTAVSSNSWLMLGIMALALVLLVPGWKLKGAGVGLGLVFLSIFLVLSSGSPILGRFNLHGEVQQALEVLGWGDPTDNSGGGTIEGRLEIWRGLFGVWQRRPWQGYGLNTAPLVNPTFVGKAAHNDFVRYLVETGVLGLSFFLLFQLLVGRRLWRLRRLACDPQDRLLANLSLALFFAWVGGSVGDNLIGFTVYQVYLWAALAAVAAALTAGKAEEVAAPALVPLREGKAPARFGPRVRTWLLSSGALQPGAPARCPRCGAPLRSPGGVVCAQCHSWTLAKGALWGGALIVVAVVVLIGFYFWNQGASPRTFFLGWFLWFLLLAVALRHHPHYPFALLAAFVVGLAGSQWWGTISREIQLAAEASWLGGGALLAGGLVESWWTTRKRGAPTPRWAALPLFLRRDALTLSALVASAFAIHHLLGAASAFLNGAALALVGVALWLSTLFILLLLISWAIAPGRWRPLASDLARIYLGFWALVQLGSWLAAAGLWGMAQALPAVPALARFAPLLRARPLGLYTWISLAVFITGTAALAVRSRLLRPRSHTGHTTGSVVPRSRR